jgi:hypothetical protein
MHFLQLLPWPKGLEIDGDRYSVACGKYVLKFLPASDEVNFHLFIFPSHFCNCQTCRLFPVVRMLSLRPVCSISIVGLISEYGYATYNAGMVGRLLLVGR